ncbi:MAG: hypothetical protein QCH35_09435 [Methanomicrobiaceae archaeon]|nr:hypothetical protein [Methanomicrobiaceae archaeon]
METNIRPEMVAIAGCSGIALGAIVLAVTVTFSTSTLFPVLLGGIVVLLLLIAVDYWQWIHREE